MFLDASVLVAVVAEESDGLVLAVRIRRADRVYTSPLALYEATLAIARSTDVTIADAQTALDRFVVAARAQVIPITAEIGRSAIEAFARFGRGIHPARLNMGDCFAYACARSLEVPLLFKGNDFAQTDIAAP
jgi:ribonuclease VapC